MYWNISLFLKKNMQIKKSSERVFYFLVVLLTAFATESIAGKRHHDKHVHGAGNLNIVLDGNILLMEFESPAMNIVGFEHSPENKDEESIIADAVVLLKNGEKLFGLSNKANCRLSDVQIETDLTAEKHEDHHHDNLEAEHKDHPENNNHSDFEVVYNFNCKNPENLKTIEVKFFSHFNTLEGLEVQMLTPRGQSAHELSPEKTAISL